MTQLHDSVSYQLGETLVDPSRNIIARAGTNRSIEPRIMEVLCFLAARPQVVVARENIIHDIWHVEYGGDESLTRAISLLRKTFKDLGENGQIIETIPRRGYRLALNPFPADGLAAASVKTAANGAEPLPPGLPSSKERAAAKPDRIGNTGPLVFFFASLAFAIFGFTNWTMRSGAVTPALVPEHSVAVLPFVSMSESEADELFADGLTEELLTRLSIIEDLKLPGRTASSAYKDKAADFKSIGEELGVAYVLEGSVRRDRERVRVTTQLVSADDGYRLWSQTYDRDGDEIFLVQDDIARRVADALNARILGDGDALKSSTGTTSASAYENYLEGRHFLNRQGAGVSRAIERFENAIEADPDFAMAYGGLASAHSLSNQYLNVPKEIARSRAASYARRSLEINNGLAEPFAVLGAIESDKNNWRKALAYFDEAEARDPDDVAALQWRAEALLYLGYLDAAKETLERALTIETGSPVLYLIAGHVANNQGNLDKADEYYRKVQSLGVEGVVFNRGLVLFQRGEIEKAAGLIATAYVHHQIIPRQDLKKLSSMFERLMRRESAVESELTAFPTLINDDDTRAMCYLFAHQSGQALRTIEADADGDHDTFYHLWSGMDPDLRQDPYFKTFVGKTGLLNYWRENGWPDKCEGNDKSDLECI